MFFIAYSKQTDKLTDITYSLTFICLIIVSFSFSERSLVDLSILALVVAWALRLGFYLSKRVNKVGKDDRFDKMRPNFFHFLGFWMLQAISVFIISLSFLLTYREFGKIPTTLFYFGGIITAFGLMLETTADFQKSKFKNKNPNLFMADGVWKFIRHPNYLGEILFWIGIFLMGHSYISNSSWIAALGPLWIIILLVKISGIPMLEKKWEQKYGDMPSFREYQIRSWRLIPYLY